MGKNLTDISFAEILPGSISDDPTIRAAAVSLDSLLSETAAQTENTLLFSAIDTMVEPLLSAMAWHLHVDYWPDDFTLTQKRSAVRESLIRHMRKGTPSAVEEAVAEVINSGAVTEWNEYGGDPGYFRIETTETLKDWETFGKRLVPNINASKNTRSWLDRITVRRSLSGNLDFKIMIAKSDRRLTIRPRMALDLSIRPFVALVPLTYTKTMIAVRQS